MAGQDERAPRSEGVDPNFLLSISINGIPYDRGNPNIPTGSVLDVSIPQEAFHRFGGFYVFRTPLAEYASDFEAIAAQDGGETDLGELPSLLVSGEQTFSTSTEVNTFYDLFYLHGGQVDAARLSTGTAPIPYRLTLDEVKLWLGFMTGQTLEELSGIKAKVVGDKFNMRNSRQFFQYGFRVGDLGATILRDNNLGMFFVDHADFWREVTPDEFGEHLRSVKANL